MYFEYNDENLNRLQQEKLEALKKLAIEDPETAKKIAMEDLIRTGIIDENGNLRPPYNGDIVNENDFTRGPKLVKRPSNIKGNK